MKLTEKQKRFADYYIETGNATESARRAGYKGKNLNNVASENLAKVGVKSYIDEKLKVLENERTASAKEVLEFLTKSMRGELDEEIVVVEGTGDGTSEASESAGTGWKRIQRFLELQGKVQGRKRIKSK